MSQQSMNGYRCPLCGGAVALQFAAVVDPQTRERFQVFACDTCQHGVTQPRPEDIARYYGRQYYGGRHSFTADYRAWRRVGLVNQAARQSETPSPARSDEVPTVGRLLDVGCGDGAFLLAARQRGWQVAGVEMYPELARAAGLDVFASLDDAVAAIEQSSPQPLFDCVTLWHVLEHLPDPLSELTSIRKLLKPEGALVVAVPNAASAQARIWGSRWLHRDVPRHLHHFSPRSIELYLRYAGFEIGRAWQGEFEYDLLGWSQSALNYLFADPNVFFEIITGKAQTVGRVERASQLTLGAMFCGLSLLPTWHGMWTGSAGTLIVAARPASA